MKNPYEDILNLPRPVSRTHPPMPLNKRAAQFMPFAALTGYDAAIEETARQTDERIVLDESAIAALDSKLALLAAADGQPEATVTYFRADEKKRGGAYITRTGRIKKIDPIWHTVVFVDGAVVPIEDIMEMDSEIFPDEAWSTMD